MKKYLFIFFCLCTYLVSYSQNESNLYKDWMIGPFEKLPVGKNPILGPNFDSKFYCPIIKRDIRWESRAIIGGAVVVKDNKIYMIYQGEDDTRGFLLHTHGSPGTMRLGLAISNNGIDFEKKGPVIYPQNDNFHEWESNGGCEIPRLIESPDGGYILFYDGWNKSKARLMVATSKDLVNWEKHGSPFTKYHGDKYSQLWSKSAAVVTELKNGKLVAAKINGKYWMYWGERGLNIATSDNLIDWKMLENPDGSLKTLLSKRKGMFDDRTIEGGVALKTEKGIVIIFNTFRFKQEGEVGDPVLASGLGQALVDQNDPTKVLDRSDVPFLIPDREYEIQGAVNNVVFATGLVFFNNKWYLYHNGGDRVLCVAVADSNL